MNTGVTTGTTNLTSSVRVDIPYRIVPPSLIAREVWLLGDSIAEQDKLLSILRNTGIIWPARDNWEHINNDNALCT